MLIINEQQAFRDQCRQNTDPFKSGSRCTSGDETGVIQAPIGEALALYKRAPLLIHRHVYYLFNDDCNRVVLHCTFGPQ
jgi:hypothetical protein